MSRRVLSLSIVTLFALSAVSAGGQSTAPVSRAEFQKAMDELKQEIKSLKEAVAPAPSGTAGATGGMPSSGVAASSSQDAELANRVAALEKQVAALQRDKEELTNIAANNSKMLKDIASETPSGNHYVPNVQAIRDDREARRELVDTVVQGITRSTGELRIHNDMSTGQSLLVNGVTTVYVPAHEARIVTVPSGTATTELAGEGTRSWMIGAPNYAQDVIIAPAVQTNLASDGSRWQYDPLTGGWWRTVP